MTDPDKLSKKNLEEICDYLNEQNKHSNFPYVEPDDIVRVNARDGNFVVLVNCGIAGVPRFVIPTRRLDEFLSQKAQEAKAKTTKKAAAKK